MRGRHGKPGERRVRLAVTRVIAWPFVWLARTALADDRHGLDDLDQLVAESERRRTPLEPLPPWQPRIAVSSEQLRRWGMQACWPLPRPSDSHMVRGARIPAWLASLPVGEQYEQLLDWHPYPGAA